MESFTKRGVIFAERDRRVLHGANLVFAHGVSPAVRESAKSMELHLRRHPPAVTKVHTEVKRFAREATRSSWWTRGTRR